MPKVTSTTKRRPSFTTSATQMKRRSSSAAAAASKGKTKTKDDQGKSTATATLNDKENAPNTHTDSNVDVQGTPPSKQHQILRATPYHQVIQESGRKMSPRATRSATKKKLQDESMGVMAPSLLVFSPPNESHYRKADEERMKLEGERQERIREFRKANLMVFSPDNKRSRMNRNRAAKKQRQHHFSPGGTEKNLELKLSYSELNLAYQELEKKFIGMQEELNNAKIASVTEKEEKIDLLEEELEKMRRSCKKKEEELNEECETKVQQAELRSNKIEESLRAELELLEVKNEQMKDELDQIESNRRKLYEELGVEKTRLQEISIENKELKDENSLLRNKEHLLTEKLSMAEKNASNQLVLLQGKQDQILSAIQNNNNDANVKQLLEDLESVRKERSNLLSEVMVLKKKLDDTDELMTREVGRYRDRLKRAEAVVDEKNKCMNDALKAQENVNAKCGTLMDQVEALMLETKDLSHRLEQEQRNSSAAQAQVLTLESDIQNLQEQYNKVQESFSVANDRICTLEADLECAKESQQNDEELAQIRSAFEESQKDKDGILRSLLMSKTENETLRAESAALAQTNTNLETEISKVRHVYEGSMSRMKTELDSLELVRKSLHNKVMSLSGNIRVFVRVRPMLPSETTYRQQQNDVTLKPHIGTPGTGSKRRRSTTVKSVTKSRRLSVKPSVGAGRAPLTPSSSVSVPPTPFRFPTIRSATDAIGTSNLACNDLTKNCLELVQPDAEKFSELSRLKRHRFGFDQIFTPQDNQEIVWDAIEPLIQSTLDGFNVTLFAYGQTGSGKTYTMLGNNERKDEEGMITRAIRMLVEANKKRTEAGGKQNELGIEMVEVYNEKVFDLLATSGNIEVSNTQEHTVIEADDAESVLEVVKKAQNRRCVRATNSNAESSRSHLLFTIHLNGQNKLNICDLAGSERLSKSGSNGVSLKETQNINSSLSCLSNVIERLQNKNSKGHIPYRDSKLTYLLKDSLSGKDSKTLAIVCCNPLVDNYQESLCSLRFASKVAKVELKAKNSVDC